MMRFVLVLIFLFPLSIAAQSNAYNEASAVGAVRTILTAEATYATSYPRLGYTCELSRLGESSDARNAYHAGLLGVELASGVRNGYRFVLRNCNGRGQTLHFYSVVAYPLKPGRSGARVFCSDQRGIIRYANGGSAEACNESSTPLR